jgi:hypothetical protein
MEIKLNKELQKKLSQFLETKDEKLNEFLKILNINKFSFTQNEINMVEETYRKNNDIKEYVYIYIGEAIINTIGGFWSICNLKRDEAYGLPIILAWGGKEDRPRICPDVWLKRIDTNRLGKPLGDLIYS